MISGVWVCFVLQLRWSDNEAVARIDVDQREMIDLSHCHDLQKASCCDARGRIGSRMLLLSTDCEKQAIEKHTSRVSAALNSIQVA